MVRVTSFDRRHRRALLSGLIGVMAGLTAGYAGGFLKMTADEDLAGFFHPSSGFRRRRAVWFNPLYADCCSAPLHTGLRRVVRAKFCQSGEKFRSRRRGR